ncbi:MAG: hypothetical protein V4534_05625 [Myxococcota bacterium]
MMLKNGICFRVLMLTVVCSILPLESAIAKESFDGFLPEVRRGLFLHLCDVIHEVENTAVRDSWQAEFNLDKLASINKKSVEKITSLCFHIYEINFKVKQQRNIAKSTFSRIWQLSLKDFTRGAKISAYDRASVFALSNDDGTRFLLRNVNDSVRELFCNQSYDRQSSIDAVWPSAHQALQALEPELILEWKNYSSELN